MQEDPEYRPKLFNKQGLEINFPKPSQPLREKSNVLYTRCKAGWQAQLRSLSSASVGDGGTDLGGLVGFDGSGTIAGTNGGSTAASKTRKTMNSKNHDGGGGGFVSKTTSLRFN